MPTNTTHRGYKAYDDVADAGQTFLSFRGITSGTSSTSNINKIDVDMQGAYDSIAGLAGSGRTTETVYQNAQNILTIKNQITKQITATASTPNTFSATNTDITSYYNGLVVLATFDSVNTGITTLNINSIGAKQLSKIDANGNAISLSAGDIQINRPILFKYNGTVFVMVSGNTADQINIADTGGLITATNVEGALQEIVGKANTAQTTANNAIPKSLATAVDQALVSTGVGAWAVKTLAEIKTWLGLGSAAYTASTAYATSTQGAKADNALPASSYTQADVLGKVADNYFKRSNYGVVQLPNITAFTLPLNYANTVICTQATGTITITIPTTASVAFPDGTQIVVDEGNASSQVVFVPASGVSLYSKDSKRSINGAFASATLIKLYGDAWLLIGDLKA